MLLYHFSYRGLSCTFAPFLMAAVCRSHHPAGFHRCASKKTTHCWELLAALAKRTKAIGAFPLMGLLPFAGDPPCQENTWHAHKRELLRFARDQLGIRCLRQQAYVGLLRILLSAIQWLLLLGKPSWDCTVQLTGAA